MQLSHRAALLSLVLLCLAVYLPGVTALPPFDQDEALFAQASKQMLESGDFIQIRFQDSARNKKPVLSYWLQAASAAAVGRRDAIWPYRIPSIVGLTLATVLTYWGGARLFGRPAAWLGAALFASSLMAVVQAHMARADAVLIPVVIAAQLAVAAVYFAAKDGVAAPRLAWLAFWVAQGLGVLIKGPIVAMTSLLTVAALFASDRDRLWLRQLRPAPGLLIAALIAAPWLIATSYATGGSFIGDAVGGDLLPKLLGVQDEHGGPPGYYLATGLVMFWPGALLVGLAVPYAWLNRADPAVRFCLAWIVPNWVLYEIVPTKLPHYTLPTFPAAALVMGAALVALTTAATNNTVNTVAAGWRTRWILPLWACVGAGCAAFAIGLPLAIEGRVGVWPIAAAVSALGATYAGWIAWRGRWWRAVGTALIGAGLWSGIMLQFVLPGTQGMWLGRLLADAVAQTGARVPNADPPVAIVGIDQPSAVFLLGTKTRFAAGSEAADHIVDRAGAIAAVTEDSAAEFLAELEKRGATARKLDNVIGFDYVWGVWRTLGLYTAAPSENSR